MIDVQLGRKQDVRNNSATRYDRFKNCSELRIHTKNTEGIKSSLVWVIQGQPSVNQANHRGAIHRNLGTVEALRTMIYCAGQTASNDKMIVNQPFGNSGYVKYLIG
jgi:hypothetical protein